MVHCCILAALINKKYHSDPLAACQHHVFSPHVMRRYHRDSRRFQSPEAWVAHHRAAGTLPRVPIYQTFVIVVYTRPNKGGRARVEVDPNLDNPLQALVWHIVRASGMGSKRVKLLLNNTPVKKKAHLAELRNAPSYSLQVVHGASGDDSIEVPSEAPVSPYANDVEEADARGPEQPQNTPSRSISSLKQAFETNSSTSKEPEKSTTLAALSRTIAQRFGEQMQKHAMSAGLSAGEVLNGYHVAHAVAHRVATDPQVYKETLMQMGMDERDASQVTPNMFWEELAQQSAAEAADNIAKNIATDVSTMSDTSASTNPERLYATKAAGNPIFRTWMNDLRYLFGLRPAPYWAYRISPAYGVYHYVPPVPYGAPVVVPVPPLPRRGNPYRRRHHDGGRRWLMMKPYRMAIASSLEDAEAAAADSSASTAAAISRTQDRQKRLCSMLAGGDIDVDMQTQAQSKIDVVTSSVQAAASVNVSVVAASEKVDVVCSDDACAAAASVSGGVTFSVPSFTEPAVPTSSVTDSVIPENVLKSQTTKLDTAALNKLSSLLMEAATGDLSDTCAIILPEVPQNATFSKIMQKINEKQGEQHTNTVKSIADNYTVPSSGQAERVGEILGGTRNEMTMCTRTPGSTWKLYRSPDNQLMLKNRKGASAYVQAFAHPTHRNVVVFTAPIYHHLE